MYRSLAECTAADHQEKTSCPVGRSRGSAMISTGPARFQPLQALVSDHGFDQRLRPNFLYSVARMLLLTQNENLMVFCKNAATQDGNSWCFARMPCYLTALAEAKWTAAQWFLVMGCTDHQTRRKASCLCLGRSSAVAPQLSLLAQAQNVRRKCGVKFFPW